MSWHRALRIPSTSVILEDKNQLVAKVLSQKDSKIKGKVQASGVASTNQQLIGMSVKHAVSGLLSPFISFRPLKLIILPWTHLCLFPAYKATFWACHF